MTATITEDAVRTVTTHDPGAAAHIVLIPAELRARTTAQAYVLEARVEGREVEALCGYRWVPQRDPKALPVCDRCLGVYKHDPNGFGDRHEMPDS